MTLLPILTGERKSILYEPIELLLPSSKFLLHRLAKSLNIIELSPIFPPLRMAIFLDF